MNGGSESTIPSTIIDESASTRTNLSFTLPLRPNQILSPFHNHCPRSDIHHWWVLACILLLGRVHLRLGTWEG
ncbi:hypothetical protein ACSQ67_021024 [Phaseolus vulgaris]